MLDGPATSAPSSDPAVQEPSAKRILAGRVALVTGASRGHGRAIAEAFWDAGASLHLVARDWALLDELVAHLTGSISEGSPRQRVEVFPADLAEPKAPAEILAHAADRFGRIDVLVNNAGVIGPIGRLGEDDPNEWEKALRVDLLAPVALCRGVVPGMIERGGGRIVNVSGGGATSPLPHFSAYATAKTALVRFSETLAAEVAGTGVAVNCFSPGPLDTRIHAQVRDAGADLAGAEMYELSQKVARGGGASFAEAAALCVFLASDECRVTGRVLSAVLDAWRRLAELAHEIEASDVYTLRRITPADRGKDWGK